MRVTDIPDDEAEDMQAALAPLLTITIAAPVKAKNDGMADDEGMADDDAEDEAEMLDAMAARKAMLKARMGKGPTGIEA